MTQIRPSNIVGAGNGLFATRDFEKGEEIVRINKPILFSTDAQLEKYEEKQNNLPDCCIWIFNSKKWIGSKTKVSKEHWYYINHSTIDANVKPQLNESTMIWIAKQPIKKGDEIFFNYNPGCKVKF
jgi:hypothetical protein